MSADGQVILYVDETELAFDEFYTLQAATVTPEPLPWATLVGQAYRLAASKETMDLSGASISFHYLGDEVPDGEENWLRVYYMVPGSGEWQILDSSLDTYHNTASAPAQGEGLYALMSSLEVPLEAEGWNLFAYPVQATRPVTSALSSIEDYYRIVYGYDSVAGEWLGYNVDAPVWANDLYELEFGHGYWISVTQAITIYMKGGAESYDPLDVENIGGLPPSTYYGSVQDGLGFTPAAGMVVSAWVDGKQCGEALTFDEAGEIVYVIDVFADGWGEAEGCGDYGEEVRFKVEDWWMGARALWDNNRWWALDLQLPNIYLPLVVR